MAQLHINDFPAEFIAVMDQWGKEQMPPLNRRQVVMKIISNWTEDVTQDNPNNEKQAKIAQLEKTLSELRGK